MITYFTPRGGEMAGSNAPGAFHVLLFNWYKQRAKESIHALLE